MRTNPSQIFGGEASTNRFLVRAMLFAFVLALLSLAVYQWLRSPVEVEVKVSRRRDYTTSVNKFMLVEGAHESAEIITLQMSRWQAWRFNRETPIYLFDQKNEGTSHGIPW